MSMITDILDGTEIPYVENGFAPGRPPQSGPCIVFHDEYDTDGADEFVGYAVHSYTIDLYDEGYASGSNARETLDRALKAANVKFHRTEPYYIYSEKRYMTIYELEDIIVKE